MTPPESLRAFPLRGGAALARGHWPGPRPFHGPGSIEMKLLRTMTTSFHAFA
jgi:hypothetical protein